MVEGRQPRGVNAVVVGQQYVQRGCSPYFFLLVPKLLLGNEIAFQALLGYVLILSLTLILAKQSLGKVNRTGCCPNTILLNGH